MEAQSLSDPAGPGAESATPEDALRGHLHGMWAGVAGPWGEHARYVDARAASLTRQMLELAAPAPGERVLELACGPGGLGLAAAERVAPDGDVVLSDVVAEMTAIAAARGAALGLTNVATRVLDLEQIDEPDESYDVVLCREGLMFALDPDRAAREIRRVLRRDGRLALSVWGPRAQNPWLAVVLDALGAELGTPMPPPGIPGPFSLDDPNRLTELLAGAYLDVVVTELPTPMRVSSFDEWWTRTSSLAGPVATILASLPDATSASLRSRVQEAVVEYETPEGLAFPGVNLLASGRRG